MGRKNSRRVSKLKKLLKIAKLLKILQEHRKNRRRIWSRQWLLRRQTRNLGSCSFVGNELRLEDLDSYKNYLRMTEEQFEKLHSYVEHKIKKNDTVLRQCIPSKYKLMVLLRYLATGESFKSLSYHTRIAACTISKFIPEVLQAICEELTNVYLKVPSKTDEWLDIAKDFILKWNTPNTIGAMDGKHIVFRAPSSAGSHYYNYKGTHSVILLAIVDANYKFIYIDVGANGRASDGGVYEDTDFQVALNQNTLHLPNDIPLPGRQDVVPFVILADAAFPLHPHILKPYPFKHMTKEERIFNYRLSRGRRVVENAFGILANRFRIFLKPINLSGDKVVLITTACCVLHNFIKIESNDTNPKEVDVELENGRIQRGCWRSDTQELSSINYKRRRPNNISLWIREEFKNYFNNEGKLAWQDEKI